MYAVQNQFEKQIKKCIKLRFKIKPTFSETNSPLVL